MLLFDSGRCLVENSHPAKCAAFVTSSYEQKGLDVFDVAGAIPSCCLWNVVE